MSSGIQSHAVEYSEGSETFEGGPRAACKFCKTTPCKHEVRSFALTPAHPK